MALNKCTYCDGQTVITAQNMNDIQDAICDLEQKTGDISAALDELHAYAQALVNGGGTE